MAHELILYTTLGCHLCHEAKDVVYRSGISAIRLQDVEIADDEALLSQYGVKIPVIRDEKTNREIAWPFDAEQFREWWYGPSSAV